ncbi:unnamed protein product [Penicillium salamii]|nr:unnamed protein product [Penicillium salamii]
MGPWLWIVDNADDISLLYGTKGSGLLKEHLPCFGDGKIILTTNDRQVARCFCTVIHRVESFTDPECEQLLSTQLDRKQLNGPHERSRLYEALQRLPLALVQAIAFIGAHQSSVKEYMKLYTGCERNRARLLNENPSGANPVTDAFEISFQMLERQCPRASTLLSTMSLFNHRAIPQRLLENLYPWSDLDMADACGKLEAYSLVTSYTVESSAPQCRAFRFYDLHQLVWLAMRHRLNLRKRSYRVIGKLKLPDITEGDFQLWATFITHLESLLSLTKKSRSRSQYHPSVHRKLEAGRLHFDLGKSLQQLGMYRSAEKQHRYALKLADRFLGKTDPHTLDVQRSLGLALVYQNKLTEAETLYRQILKLAKDLQDPSTLGDLSMLSLIFNSRGRYWQKKATRLQKRVLRQRTEKLSELHEDTLASKNSLGLIMASRCKFREAELLFECTLRKRKDLLGGTHRSTLSTMSNLAMVLDSLNYPQKAEALQQTAFTRRKQTLGISHPQTLASMNHLAKLLDDQGCYSDAAQMFLEIYKLRAASVIWWEV